MRKPKVKVVSKEECEGVILSLERKHPDFKELYEDEDICSCCKADYREWSWEKVKDWKQYESYRFLGGE